MDKTVFISYRRDATGKAFAGRIHDALKHRGYDPFLDVNNLGPGVWAQQIASEVPKRAHFLLLLTPGALDRCHQADDMVRQEYELARTSGRNIVPVKEETMKVGDYEANAPASMSTVFKLQIAELQHARYDADVERLTRDYIPTHKAPQQSAATGMMPQPPSAPKHRLLHWLLKKLGPFSDVLFTIVVIGAFIYTFQQGASEGQWNMFYIPLSVLLRGMGLLVDLPRESSGLGFVALLFMCSGGVLVLSHLHTYKKIIPSWLLGGCILAAYGAGVASALANIVKSKRPSI
jgi:hypothetical protein